MRVRERGRERERAGEKGRPLGGKRGCMHIPAMRSRAVAARRWKKVGRLRERRRRPKASRIAPSAVPKYRTELARPHCRIRLSARQVAHSQRAVRITRTRSVVRACEPLRCSRSSLGNPGDRRDQATSLTDSARTDSAANSVFPRSDSSTQPDPPLARK